MIQLNINLPRYKRLHIHLANRRPNSTDLPLFPKLEEFKRVKKGSRVSRYFRRVFEHKSVKKILGTNIAFAIIATTLLPNQSGIINVQADEPVIAESPIVLPTEKEVRFPTDPVKITQGYKLFHPALDLDGITGDSIYPFMRGTVEAIDHSKYAYGNAIYINHGDGITSLYAHLSKILVKIGDEVTTNDVIGLMGATGNAHGDHLHFEIRKFGVPINPLTTLSH